MISASQPMPVSGVILGAVVLAGLVAWALGQFSGRQPARSWWFVAAFAAGAALIGATASVLAGVIALMLMIVAVAGLARNRGPRTKPRPFTLPPPRS